MRQATSKENDINTINAVHFFATCVFGWSTAPTRDEAIEKLVNRFRSDFKKIVKNSQKDGIPGAYVWSCQVNAPAETQYKIEWFQPVGVDIEECHEHAVTYLTDKQLAHCRTYEGEAKALRKELDALTDAVKGSESIHDDSIQQLIS